jgi:hypothetical protein
MTKARGLADLGNVYSDGALSNRNLIINGAMTVAQRGTSLAGVTGGGYHTVDRIRANIATIGTYTITQETDAPDGFANSYKIEVTTADAAPAATDNMALDQRFEGYTLLPIKKGTASAAQTTLSFWVKSNKTGTYNLEFEDFQNSRNVIAAYTVDASDAWELKTMTFPADASGPIVPDNSNSARVMWWLATGTFYNSGTRNTTWAVTANADRAVGNVNLADTIGNYFQITGVQLEVGDTATPFEHRSFGQELALCQRYYYRLTADTIANFSIATGTKVSTSTAATGIIFPTPMRAAPTSFETNGVATDYAYVDGATARTCTAVPNSTQINAAGAQLNMTTLAGAAAGSTALLRLNTLNSYIAWDAEL